MIDSFVRSDFAAVDKREPVGRVLGYSRGDTDRVPVVLDGGRPYGVVNERALVRQRLDPGARVEGFVLATPVLEPTTPVSVALEEMARARTPVLPVGDEARLLGVVRAIDLLQATTSPAGFHARAAIEQVPVLSPGDRAATAEHHFHTVRAPALPVVGDGGRLLGVVERRAILALERDPRPDGRKTPAGEVPRPLDAPVGGILDRHPPRVDPGDGYTAVVETLAAFGYAVVAASDERPLGLLTPEGLATLVGRA